MEWYSRKFLSNNGFLLWRAGFAGVVQRVEKLQHVRQGPAAAQLRTDQGIKGLLRTFDFVRAQPREDFSAGILEFAHECLPKQLRVV